MSGPTFASLQFPALSILGANVLISFREVGYLELLGVPMDSSVDSLGDVAQAADFGKRAGIGEVRAGRLARLAGSNPVLLV